MDKKLIIKRLQIAMYVAISMFLANIVQNADNIALFGSFTAIINIILKLGVDYFTSLAKK